MPFTVAELENIANATLEFHWDTPNVRSQSIQNKPLLKKMRDKQSTFPGGKDNITGRVKGEYTSGIQGFVHDDNVTYRNPANIRKFTVPWKLVHCGISFTMHELIENGIEIVDTSNAEGDRRKSDREKILLADLLKDKMEDMTEGWDRTFNTMLWQDGTQDPKLVPGITSFILDDPTSATVVAGIDQSSNDWWRNRANTTITLGDTTGASQAVFNTLQSEMRQLRRYGKGPDCFLCGSDWLDRCEKELRAKGNYTDTGWATSGGIDASVSDVKFKGIRMEYDPTLDGLGKSKYMYAIDSRAIMLKAVQGESMKKHSPARPENQYVFYRAVTWVGGLICNQRNTSGVYAFS